MNILFAIVAQFAFGASLSAPGGCQREGARSRRARAREIGAGDRLVKRCVAACGAGREDPVGDRSASVNRDVLPRLTGGPPGPGCSGMSTAIAVDLERGP